MLANRIRHIVLVNRSRRVVGSSVANKISFASTSAPVLLAAYGLFGWSSDVSANAPVAPSDP